MEKKYQIFISSTYTDLKDARTKVRDAILSMYHFPVGMELFGAANEEQWQIIKETIDSSDYYVLIIGQRYGSVISYGEDDGISYTEKEFNYALEKKIPVLAFLLDDSVPVKPEDIETEHRSEFEAFKATIKTGRIVEWWKNPDDLAQKVTVSLYKQITRTKRPGWIRGDAVDIEKSLKAITDLSERNQILAEENKELLFENQTLKQKSERRPMLTITLGCTKPGNDEAHNEYYQREDLISITDDTVIIKLKKLSTTEKETEYNPIRKSDIPPELQRYISDQEITEYNRNLPSKDEVEKYLDTYKFYSRLMENGVPITFYINNIGTAKATDVSAIIEFPDQVRVFDFEEIMEIPELEKPKKPKNPIDLAYIKAERERAYALDLDMPVFNNLDKLPNLSAYINSPISASALYESIEINDNVVEIEQKQGIVHTKFDYFPGAYVVPLELGEYEAKVTLMCAEYEDPKEAVIKFVVEN